MYYKQFKKIIFINVSIVTDKWYIADTNMTLI